MRTTKKFDLKIENLTRSVKAVAQQLSERTACAGFIANGDYKYSDLNVAQLAAVLHYGAIRTNRDGTINYLPPRRFMDKAIRGKYEKAIKNILYKGMHELFNDNSWVVEDYNSARNVQRFINPILREVSQQMAENIKEAMRNETYAPLDPGYAHAWGKSKFLDNSEDFINSVQSWVAEVK